VKLNLPPKVKMVGENLLVYGIAGAVIWYESRALNFHKEVHDFLNGTFCCLFRRLWLLF
jgi:hypothetical protein